MKNTMSLTGLRFVAAALIVFHHSQTGYFVKEGSYHPFVLNGMVTLFFVLSGFVLALNSSKYERVSDFVVARIARIWPAHAFTFLLLIVLLWPFTSPWFEPQVPLFTVARMLPNLALLQAWSPNVETYWSFNAPSWSISVELFFYVTFFIVFRWTRHYAWIRGILLMVIALGATLLIPMFLPGLDPLWIGYINPLVNLPAFALGVGVGQRYAREDVTSAGYARSSTFQVAAFLIAIAANAAAVLIADHMPVAARMFFSVSGAAPAYVLLIVALARYDGVLSRALSLPFMLVLGEVSYALYLVHQVIIRYHSFKMAQLSAVPIWLQYIAIWAISLGTAFLCHYVIERPARRAIVSAWRRWRSDSFSKLRAI